MRYVVNTFETVKVFAQEDKRSRERTFKSGTISFDTLKQAEFIASALKAAGMQSETSVIFHGRDGKSVSIPVTHLERIAEDIQDERTKPESKIKAI